MQSVLDFVAAHRKLIVAVATGVVLVLGAVLGETSTAYIAVVSILGALGVYQVPNSY